jgi:Rrf2 family protein
MISVTAQHALRALVEMARLESTASITGRELARTASIPPNYLAKILRALGAAGLIAAARGTGGGYRLNRLPGTIRLADVVRLFDPARSASDCLMDGAHPCSDETACAAHHKWRHVKDLYVRFLDTTTLENLAAGHENARLARDDVRPRSGTARERRAEKRGTTARR